MLMMLCNLLNILSLWQGNIKHFLSDFATHVGLQINCGKSSICFANCDGDTIKGVTDILNFRAQELPVRYLGSPLFSSRLYVKDCITLLDQVRNRLSGWKSALLSYAGRTELIVSTLSTLHPFCVNSFLLPQTCLKLLDQHTSDFFWGTFDGKKCMKTIAWKKLFLPKAAGGLGIRSFRSTAAAALLRQVWRVASHQKSIWVAWATSKYIKEKSFWDLKTPSSCSWSWRGILSMRSMALQHFCHLVGDGEHTNF